MKVYKIIAAVMAKNVYICAVHDCRKVFSKPSRLVQHARTHTGEVRLLVYVEIAGTALKWAIIWYFCSLRPHARRKNTKTAIDTHQIILRNAPITPML